MPSRANKPWPRCQALLACYSKPAFPPRAAQLSAACRLYFVPRAFFAILRKTRDSRALPRRAPVRIRHASMSNILQNHFIRGRVAG